MEGSRSEIRFQSQRNRPIRAVVFDAVGTLMYARPSVTAVYCDVIGRAAGRQLDEESVRSVLQQRLAARANDTKLTTSEAAERQFWFDLIAELVADTSRTQSCFETLYEHFACPENWGCYDDVAETLVGLKNAGLRLAIASNFDQRLHRVCRGLTDLDPVPVRIISSEIGWRKPAKAFFEVVCQETHCLPEEILFVGDDVHSDIHGARMAGMTAVWINRRGEPAGAVSVLHPQTSNDEVWRIRSLRELC